MSIRAILQEKDALRVELQDLIAKHPDGNLPPEAEARSQELERRAVQLNRLESLQVTADDLERRSTGQQLNGTADGQLDRLVASTGLLDAVRAQVPGMIDSRGAGQARELSTELSRRYGLPPAQGCYWSMRAPARVEQRAGVISSLLPGSGPGSNITPTDYLGGEFIDLLRAQPRVAQLGARVLTGLTGNVAIPKKTAGTSVGWVADNSALTLSDMAFGQITMTPNHVGTYVEYSRNMLLQSSPDIENIARSDMAASIALEIDRAAVNGSGGVQPLGLLNNADVDTTSVTAGSAGLTYASLVDLVQVVADENADQGSLGFLCTGSVRSDLMKLEDGNLRPYGLDMLFQGYPYRWTNAHVGNSPALNAVIFGNWSELLIGAWSLLDVLVNPFETTAYTKGNVQVRAMATVDIAVRHGQSFAAILNAQGI